MKLTNIRSGAAAMRVFIAVGMALLMAALASAAQAQGDASRGQLLYETHCIACHSTQVHWREQRLATDWASLATWVRRWQASAHLDWNEQDVAEVAAYLNALYYRFPRGAAWWQDRPTRSPTATALPRTTPCPQPPGPTSSSSSPTTSATPIWAATAGATRASAPSHRCSTAWPPLG